MIQTKMKVVLPWWYRLVANIPLVNLLYTLKTHVTFRFSYLNGDPIRSIFSTVRILKFGPKMIDVKYILDEYMVGRNNYITILCATTNRSHNPIMSYSDHTDDQKEFHRYGEKSELEPNVWYTQKLDLTKVLTVTRRDGR